MRIDNKYGHIDIIGYEYPSKQQIKYKAFVGKTVLFQYKNIVGSFLVTKYSRINGTGFFNIEYNEKTKTIYCNSVKNGRLRDIVEFSPKNNYLYDVGDMIGNLIIIDKYISKSGIHTYKTQCNKCKRFHTLKQYQITNYKCDCDNCIFKNKYPNLVHLLENPMDAYTYSFNVHDVYRFKCPVCGHVKSYEVSVLLYSKFSCDMCSDYISYPEKFISNILNQLNIDYTYQLSNKHLEWCKKYRYDFYIKNKQCIIEVNGMQHYQKSFPTGRTIQEEIENDINKKILALNNNIQYYIVLDCRNSNMEWIKTSVLSSELLEILNFKENDINWEQCDFISQSSLVKECCELYNDGVTPKKISEIVQISVDTVTKYLIKGSKLNLCDYVIYESKKFSHILHKIKPFRCINTGDVFFDVKDCVLQSQKLFGTQLSKSAICRVLNKIYNDIKGYSFEFIDKKEYLNEHYNYVISRLEERSVV